MFAATVILEQDGGASDQKCSLTMNYDSGFFVSDMIYL
jgi:hypothetical protein